ncbi:MAG: alpha/beta hydrolase [Hyphomicrobiaceae bacterium]
MSRFRSDGVSIAYLDEPAEGALGEPIVLIHGFASNRRVNWVDTGWVSTLTRAGYRVIAFDNRGHGDSDKPHDTERYGARLMAEDARRLLDHLAIERAHVMGYSMGARIAAFLALAHPDRVGGLVFGGLGINMVRGVGGARPIAAAFRAASIDDVTNATARTFRAFAEQTGSDLEALAACILSSREQITAEALAGLTSPVLVAVGSDDVIGGPAGELASLIPGAEAFVIAGRDHMKAVGDRSYKARVIEFLARWPLA